MSILYSFHFLSIKIPLEDGDMYNRFIITIKVYAYWIFKEVIQASMSRMELLKVSLRFRAQLQILNLVWHKTLLRIYFATFDIFLML